MMSPRPIRTTVIAGTFLVACMAMLSLAPSARAADSGGGADGGKALAPDFPPGVFSDGGTYSLADFRGRVVVLFFYEKDCPTCRGTIPERNKLVEKYRGKPVRFIAIASGDTPQQASAYVNSTHLAMPAFSDALNVMQQRYGFRISLRNIYQTRVIGPDGTVVGHDMDEATIDRALASASWKYVDKGYDPKLATAAEAFEWGQTAIGLRLLKPHLKSSNKALAESANKLLADVRAEGAQWKQEADRLLEEGKKGEAFDLYQRLVGAFGTNDELGRAANEALRKLRTDKALTDELAARRMWDQLAQAAARATPQQAPMVFEAAQTIAKRYPQTSTGQQAAEYAKDVEAAAGAER